MNHLTDLFSVLCGRQTFFGIVSIDNHLKQYVFICQLHNQLGKPLGLWATFSNGGLIKKLNLKNGEKVSFEARVEISPTFEFLEDLSLDEYDLGYLSPDELFDYRFVYPTKVKIIDEFPWKKGWEDIIDASTFSLN